VNKAKYLKVAETLTIPGGGGNIPFLFDFPVPSSRIKDNVTIKGRVQLCFAVSGPPKDVGFGLSLNGVFLKNDDGYESIMKKTTNFDFVNFGIQFAIVYDANSASWLMTHMSAGFVENDWQESHGTAPWNKSGATLSGPTTGGDDLLQLVALGSDSMDVVLNGAMFELSYPPDDVG
jgi:hypothetical protein